MNLFWAVFFPSLFVFVCGLGLLWALGFRLKFVKKARDLRDVYKDFEELHIEEFADLVSTRADEHVNRGWVLGWGLRRRAALGRIRIVRDWLRKMAVNGSLCSEVGRFHINKIENAANTLLTDPNHFAVRLLDRGAMCHFMAGVCLVKMYWLAFRIIAWPFALPRLAECFEVRGHNLTAWYGHLVEDVLEVAKQEGQPHWLFDNARYTLTGLVEMPDEFFRKFGLEDES